MDPSGHHFRCFFDVFFGTPFRTSFASVLGRFWRHFGRYFGLFFGSGGFLDFFNPSCAKTILWRTGGGAFCHLFRLFFWTSSGRPSGDDFVRILELFWAPFWHLFAVFLRHIFRCVFKHILVPPGGGQNPRVGRGSAPRTGEK